jgi:TonB family protein
LLFICTHRQWWLFAGLCLVVCFLAATNRSQTVPRPITVAVLDFAKANIGKVASERLATKLAATAALAIVDRDLGRAAARGAGYSGSLNLSLSEARDLGAAIGCDFYFVGDAQTVHRSPSTGPEYFESYASIFLVSTRTGRLISWERPSFEAATAAAAEKLLLDQLAKEDTRQHYQSRLEQAQMTERQEREISGERTTAGISVVDGATDDAKDSETFRTPRPYRRLKPAYPDSAARAEAEGTVDVLVDIDQAGEISRVDVARWAGFGLDEAALGTVRQLHFFPATRDGIAIPIRVLLRYNFRKPPK